MIGIIDYGMGNLGSVGNACRYLGRPFRVATEAGHLAGCRALILPGVGAFGDCMRRLEQQGLVGPIREWVAAGRPFLGICLGLQLLYESSAESPGVKGLGILDGTVRRFPPSADWKMPQIGWNRVHQSRTDCPLFQQVPDGAYFYFVHAYYAEARGAAFEAGRTSYGVDYTSVVGRANILAVQFHPEKSQRHGLQMLRNFMEWSGAGGTGAP